MERQAGAVHGAGRVEGKFGENKDPECLAQLQLCTLRKGWQTESGLNRIRASASNYFRINKKRKREIIWLRCILGHSSPGSG